MFAFNRFRQFFPMFTFTNVLSAEYDDFLQLDDFSNFTNFSLREEGTLSFFQKLSSSMYGLEEQQM